MSNYKWLQEVPGEHRDQDVGSRGSLITCSRLWIKFCPSTTQQSYLDLAKKNATAAAVARWTVMVVLPSTGPCAALAALLLPTILTSGKLNLLFCTYVCMQFFDSIAQICFQQKPQSSLQRNGQIVSSWGHARGDGVANGTFMDSLMLSMAQKIPLSLGDHVSLINRMSFMKKITFSFLAYLDSFTQLKSAIVFLRCFVSNGIFVRIVLYVENLFSIKII